MRAPRSGSRRGPGGRIGQDGMTISRSFQPEPDLFCAAGRKSRAKKKKCFGQNVKIPLTYALPWVTIWLPALQVYALIFLIEMGVLIVG